MTDCLFCKIAQKKIPARIAYEDESAVAFHDINPQAPIHLLIIPRRHIPSVSALTAADEVTAGHLLRVAASLAATFGVASSGYRTLFNTGPNAGQTVFHLHLHFIAGRPMGWPPFPV